MKYPGKPAKPSEPKKPDEWIDFEIKKDLYEGAFILSHMALSDYDYQGMEGRDKLIKYISKNLDKWIFEKEWVPYEDYQSCHLVIKIPKEAKIFKDHTYKDKYNLYQKNLAAYPAKLAEYEKKLAAWEAGREPFEKIERGKRIAAARKILEEEGEI